jgi:hypothetical protein
MSVGEIETELAAVAAMLRGAIANGTKTSELEARKFRLRAEQRFREKGNG